MPWTPQFNLQCLNLYLIIMKYFTKNKPGTSFFTLIDGEDGIMVSSSESSSESPSSSASCHSTLGPRWKRRRVPRCKTRQFVMMRSKICECIYLVQYWCLDTWGQDIFTNECNSSSPWWRVFKDSVNKRLMSARLQRLSRKSFNCLSAYHQYRLSGEHWSSTSALFC